MILFFILEFVPRSGRVHLSARLSLSGTIQAGAAFTCRISKDLMILNVISFSVVQMFKTPPVSISSGSRNALLMREFRLVLVHRKGMGTQIINLYNAGKQKMHLRLYNNQTLRQMSYKRSFQMIYCRLSTAYYRVTRKIHQIVAYNNSHVIASLLNIV